MLTAFWNQAESRRGDLLVTGTTDRGRGLQPR
jgi:hypothetical protein